MTAPPIDWHDLCTNASDPDDPDPDSHLRDLKYQGANTVDLYRMTTIQPPQEYL